MSRVNRIFRTPHPDGVTFRRIRERLSELERERIEKLRELESIEEFDVHEQEQATELLDLLPIGELQRLDLYAPSV